MEPKQKFTIRSRLRSFVYAWQGICRFITEEHNARIHAVATIIVIAAARIFEVSRMEWIALIGVIGLVWMAEMLNTCIERLADMVTLEQHPQIKYIKDLAAGAVLVAAAVAVATGLIIFIPRIL